METDALTSIQGVTNTTFSRDNAILTKRYSNS